MVASSDGTGGAGLGVGSAVGAGNVGEREGARDGAGVALAVAFVGVILAGCESDGVGAAEPPAQTLPPTTAATRPMTTSAAAAIATVRRGPKGRRRPRRGWLADCICASYRPRPWTYVGRGSERPRRPLRWRHVAGRFRRGGIGTLPAVRRHDR